MPALKQTTLSHKPQISNFEITNKSQSQILTNKNVHESIPDINFINLKSQILTNLKFSYHKQISISNFKGYIRYKTIFCNKEVLDV